MVILETKALTIDFGGVRAVNQLDIEIQEGEILGLIGPNGAGKTTCLNIVTGFLKPSSGLVTFRKESITGLKPYEIAERGIIRTFQITSLFPDLTSEENVIVGSYLKTNGNIWGALSRSKTYRNQQTNLKGKAKEILNFVGLNAKRDIAAGKLPFGDQRKLEIAIALAGEPRLLLLDEPAAGMSPDESTKLMSLILSIRKIGTTVWIVEHNMKVVMELCDRIVVLNYGTKIAEGAPKAIASDEKVISVYLGK